MERACAWCGREDIPEAMEQAVAALILDMEGREAAVKSVTRGDTAVTYAVTDGQSAALGGAGPVAQAGAAEGGVNRDGQSVGGHPRPDICPPCHGVPSAGGG